MNETQYNIEINKLREGITKARKIMLDDITSYIEECETTEGLSEQTQYFLALIKSKVDGYK